MIDGDGSTRGAWAWHAAQGVGPRHRHRVAGRVADTLGCARGRETGSLPPLFFASRLEPDPLW